MNKNTKTVLYVLGGVVVSVVGVFAYTLLKNRKSANITDLNIDEVIKEESQNTGTQNNEVADNEAILGQAIPSRESFPLQIGMYGKNVHVMQQALKELGNYSGAIDGKYGALTDEALDKGGSRYNGSMCGNWLVGACEVTMSGFNRLMADAKREKGFDKDVALLEAEKMYL